MWCGRQFPRHFFRITGQPSWKSNLLIKLIEQRARGNGGKSARTMRWVFVATIFPYLLNILPPSPSFPSLSNLRFISCFSMKVFHFLTLGRFFVMSNQISWKKGSRSFTIGYTNIDVKSPPGSAFGSIHWTTSHSMNICHPFLKNCISVSPSLNVSFIKTFQFSLHKKYTVYSGNYFLHIWVVLMMWATMHGFWLDQKSLEDTSYFYIYLYLYNFY